MYYLLMLVIILFDQISKYLIRINFDLQESLPIWDGIFHLTYVQNKGAAFSIFEGQLAFTIGFPVVVMALLFFYIIKHGKDINTFMGVALSLILAGGIGNLIDRILLGFVTDFFDFRIWPVFNIADISVCVGCGLLLIYVLFIEGKAHGRKG